MWKLNTHTLAHVFQEVVSPPSIIFVQGPLDTHYPLQLLHSMLTSPPSVLAHFSIAKVYPNISQLSDYGSGLRHYLLQLWLGQSVALHHKCNNEIAVTHHKHLCAQLQIVISTKPRALMST